MRCPFCHFESTRVVDSRLAEPGDSIRRRRECARCEERFTTYERVEGPALYVTKRDGSREQFDRDKLIRGMLRSTNKRPVEVSDLEELADKIEGEARRRGGQVEAEWIGGANGPALGARYRGHVKRNENWPALYWTTCEITACVPGEVFEFAVMMRNRPVNTWRYEFRATDDGGTDVTESFDLGDNLFTKIWRPLGGVLRERRNERDMLRTLQRVKAVAEGQRAGSQPREN